MPPVLSSLLQDGRCVGPGRSVARRMTPRRVSPSINWSGRLCGARNLSVLTDSLGDDGQHPSDRVRPAEQISRAPGRASCLMSIEYVPGATRDPREELPVANEMRPALSPLTPRGDVPLRTTHWPVRWSATSIPASHWLKPRSGLENRGSPRVHTQRPRGLLQNVEEWHGIVADCKWPVSGRGSNLATSWNTRLARYAN